MSLDDDDDFWSKSDSKAFNFDDEDQAPGAKTLVSILAARPSSNEPFLKPSMIMCNGDKIERLIEHLDSTISQPQTRINKQDPKTYIRDIVDKRVPIDFSPYKSKREKLLLLDCAICCSDGGAITAATIFMSRTLKSSIFIEEMRKRPIAVDHYMNYLEVTGKPKDILDSLR